MPQDKNKIWKEFLTDAEKKLNWGFENGLVGYYTDTLIEKLRNIYDGGMPASIILLSIGLCNGNCYDRALLLSRAFLDTEYDVKLVYADVNSIKLNPEYQNDGDGYADHCFVEITTKDGITYVYDTSQGLVFNKEFYYAIEKPTIRKINNKQSIADHIAMEKREYPQDFKPITDSALLIIPILELSYDTPGEKYAKKGFNLLQREIELYKKKINYNRLKAEMDKEIKRMTVGLPENFFKNNNESE